MYKTYILTIEVNKPNGKSSAFKYFNEDHEVIEYVSRMMAGKNIVRRIHSIDDEGKVTIYNIAFEDGRIILKALETVKF